GRDPLRFGWEHGQVPIPAVRQLATLHADELVGQVGMRRAVPLEGRLPSRAELAAPGADAMLEMLQHAVGHQELRVLGPPVGALPGPAPRLAGRLAGGGRGVVLVGRAVADVAVDDDEGRAIVAAPERLERAIDELEVVRVADARDVPAVTEEARGYV